MLLKSPEARMTAIVVQSYIFKISYFFCHFFGNFHDHGHVKNLQTLKIFSDTKNSQVYATKVS